MNSKLIVRLFLVGALFQSSAVYAVPMGQSSQGQGGPGQMMQVDTNDTQIQQVAAYAAQNINNGSLVKVISAQKQGTGDVNYMLQIEVVDANGTHRVYNTEVCVPGNNTPWRVKSVSQQNRS